MAFDTGTVEFARELVEELLVGVHRVRVTLRRSAKPARSPATSPMFHSTGCSRKQPFVRCVVPTFLAAGNRFLIRTGSSAPSGISNGTLATSM